jgi:uncharacterized membrane protein YGL010W
MVRVWCPLVLWNMVQSLRVKAGVAVFFVVVCWVWWCAGGLVVGKGIFEHPHPPLDFSVMDWVL